MSNHLHNQTQNDSKLDSDAKIIKVNGHPHIHRPLEDQMCKNVTVRDLSSPGVSDLESNGANDDHELNDRSFSTHASSEQDSNDRDGEEEEEEEDDENEENKSEPTGAQEEVPVPNPIELLDASSIAQPPKPFPINDKNQRLITESKHRIRKKFASLEKRLDLPSSQPNLRISDGDLSLHDLGSSIETSGDRHSAATIISDASTSMDRELAALTQKLRIKENEVEKMSKFRHQVELELDELTASLFQEANRMVWEAKSQKARAEKSLKEANMKIDVLQAEVKALKSLVLNSSSNCLTSSSSSGIRTLPTIGQGRISTLSLGQNLTTLKSNLSPKSLMKSSKSSGLRGILQKASLQSTGRTKPMSDSGQVGPTLPVGKSLIKNHSSSKSLSKRCPSNYELGGEALSAPASVAQTNKQIHLADECISISSVGEIDALFFDEFIVWRQNPTLDSDRSAFMRRLYAEDIRPLFDVPNNRSLIDRLIEAITWKNVIIELNAESACVTKYVYELSFCMILLELIIYFHFDFLFQKMCFIWFASCV